MLASTSTFIGNTLLGPTDPDTLPGTTTIPRTTSAAYPAAVPRRTSAMLSSVWRAYRSTSITMPRACRTANSLCCTSDTHPTHTHSTPSAEAAASCDRCLIYLASRNKTSFFFTSFRSDVVLYYFQVVCPPNGGAVLRYEVKKLHDNWSMLHRAVYVRTWPVQGSTCEVPQAAA